MKRKKLTEMEWYLAAQWYVAELYGEESYRFRVEHGLSESAADRISDTVNRSLVCEDGIGCFEWWCRASQYCLERAGIPAGDR